ncbi:hypothetical protein [Sinomonas sp. P10A9]|uniref:Uncharacterized protein n=1 Tax=Sinomonas puerhi TaxID=3238584 RepID=A0AB39L049_9MICC
MLSPSLETALDHVLPTHVKPVWVTPPLDTTWVTYLAESAWCKARTLPDDYSDDLVAEDVEAFIEDTLSYVLIVADLIAHGAGKVLMEMFGPVIARHDLPEPPPKVYFDVPGDHQAAAWHDPKDDTLHFGPHLDRTVVLHELAHWLSKGDRHGYGFRSAYVALVHLLIGVTAAEELDACLEAVPERLRERVFWDEESVHDEIDRIHREAEEDEWTDYYDDDEDDRTEEEKRDDWAEGYLRARDR